MAFLYEFSPCSAYRGTLRSIRAREYQKDEKINAVSLSSRKPMATMSAETSD
jgi:hypothetical protein